MQLEIKIVLSDSAEVAKLAEALTSLFPQGPEKSPEKSKNVKPDKKEKVAGPEAKPAEIEPDKKVDEPKTDSKDAGEFDISTPESIEAGRVKLRAKVAALNEAGYMEFTKKAINSTGAPSITKMNPEKFVECWDKFLLIEAGQTDKI